MLDLWLEGLRHFHFLRPWWLLALIPAGLVLRYLWTAEDPRSQWRGMIAEHLLSPMLVRGAGRAWLNPVTLAAVTSLLLITALAGPSWERRPSPFVEDQAALIIALDVSSTMDQNDIQPSRLERAKLKISDLMELRGGARTGLIVYAGTAHTVMPLTDDSDVMLNFLSAIETGMMPRPGKAPERALPLADRLFRDTELPGTFLLMADGVGPNSQAAFSDYFSAAPHQLLVYGIGADGADDAVGTLALEGEALMSLAAAAGGSYQLLTPDKQDVARISRRVESNFATIEDDSRPWVDAGYYLLIPVTLMMLFWFRRGWTLHWVFALVLLGGAADPARARDFRFADLWLTADQQGRFYLERGDYATAAERFRDPAWKAAAYYLNEDFTLAAELFVRIESADGFFNLGNAYAHGREYLRARAAYDRALELEPGHAGAAKNRQVIQAIIDEINRISESQQAEAGEDSDELAPGDPQTAEGAEREDMITFEREQLTADQLLKDARLNDLWMQQVQQNPADFLAAKFFMQLERRRSADDGEAEQ